MPAMGSATSTLAYSTMMSPLKKSVTVADEAPATRLSKRPFHTTEKAVPGITVVSVEIVPATFGFRSDQNGAMRGGPARKKPSSTKNDELGAPKVMLPFAFT